MEKQHDVVHLTEAWFEDTPSTMTSAYFVGDGHTRIDGTNPSYSTTYTWPYTYFSYAKIKLTLSEVEHLRALCLKDAKLRKTMRKLAPVIEIEVDFPGR